MTDFNEILHDFEATFINFKYFASRFLSEAVQTFEVGKAPSWCTLLNIARCSPLKLYDLLMPYVCK